MSRWIRSFILLCACLALAAAEPRPKLVLVIVVDQFRYDYLTRFCAEYTGGIDRLLKEGAVFTNAHLEHFPTVTALGHMVVLTGAAPSVSGIIGNEWYDRASGRRVTNVSDPGVKLLGGKAGAGAGAGSSPHRLLVSTVGDELKMAGLGDSRVIGISLKDRGAILPSGRMADAAYWFDEGTGNFVSSSYYFQELPGWVSEYNARRPADRWTGAEWAALPSGRESDGARSFLKLPAAAGAEYYRAMTRSPYGNDLLIAFAERLIEMERLGARDATDILTVAFSSNDWVGHDVGPDAPEVRDISIRTDRLLADFFEFLDRRAGLGNVLVVFTSDHGVAPLPEVQAERNMPGGRIREQSLRDVAQAAIAGRYGEGKWVLDSQYGTIYLNQDLIGQKNLRQAEVEETAAEALAAVPHVARVYTREQLGTGRFVADRIGRRVAFSFHPQRSGDVYTLLEPYWMYSQSGTTHGSVYSYDSHLPLIFMGPGIRPGRYNREVAINDIAPTLATLLDIETPSGSTGRMLVEAIQPPDGVTPR